MKVLFYAGYFKNQWNSEHHAGTGGSEIAIVNVAESLVKFGWTVVVSGNVLPAKINGVDWVHVDDIHRTYFDQFDLIVGVSYIHFALEFSEYRAKKLFWAHNTDYHPWYRGKWIEDSDRLLSPEYIDGFICLTYWHRDQWSQKYSIDPKRIHVVGNGIDPGSFIGHPPKVRNSFIWSSAPERGLIELLDNWGRIKGIIPDASLRIYSPGYSVAEESKWGREGLQDVYFMGTVSQEELHRAMLRAEYWPYLTNYEETYCITALEMQYAGVVPIVTRLAALNETVHSGIIIPESKQKWDECIQILQLSNRSLTGIARKRNFQFAKIETWDVRSYEWKNLIESYVYR